MYSTRFVSMVLLFGLGLLCGQAVHAQPQGENNSPDAILILDASGSMWGQIDGVNKIVIAKDVVEGLVRSLPPDQQLGLVAYGHRREGDCKDIETLAGVGATRETLITGIRGLSPTGKTPLSDSVEHAATTLDFKRNAATVILVSDGLENCDVDPCALARTLEEEGLDFTVHVIGFDVTQEERAGLECIAAETGGDFLTADNATDLGEALLEVTIVKDEESEAVDAEPVASTLAMKATILPGGPIIQSQLEWTVFREGSDEAVFSAQDVGSVETQLPPGNYHAKATWSGWRDGSLKTGSLDFAMAAQQARVITVPIDLALPVTLTTPDEVAEGSQVDISWSGPDELGTTIGISVPDDAPLRRLYFFNTLKERNKDKTAADTNNDGVIDNNDLATSYLGAPIAPGDYEIRYVLSDPPIILARQPLLVQDSQFTLTVPETAPVSTVIDIEWDGPFTAGDFVTLVPKGDERVFDNGRYKPLSAETTAQLTTPAEPGEYEIRYVMYGGYTTYPGMQRAVQNSVPIVVTGVSASVSGPASAVGGSTIDVRWIGPEQDWANDFLSVVTPGAEKFNRFSNAKIAARGTAEAVNPAPIRVPAIAGEYEIVYVMEPGQRIIARTPITIEQAQATVDAPDTVKAGSPFTVRYSGDAFSGDRVVIAAADTPDTKMWSYTPRYGFIPQAGENEGQVTEFAIAAGPGEYEARYVTGLQHQVIARDRFTVAE